MSVPEPIQIVPAFQPFFAIKVVICDLTFILLYGGYVSSFLYQAHCLYHRFDS